MHVAAILAAAGRGRRLGAASPKQLLMLGGRPILERSFDALVGCDLVTSVVVALPADLAAAPPGYLARAVKPVTVVAGGARRRDSVANAFAVSEARADVVVIHDAARPLASEALIRRTIEAASASGAAVAAVRAQDTVKQADATGLVQATLDRERIYLAQTPQAFRRSVLRDALAVSGDATDEAWLAERAGHPVRLVEGDPRNLKITTPDDLALAERLLGVSPRSDGLRVGNGYDLHRLVPGRPLVLGGCAIPFDKGLDGHSDADAVSHAVTDAILGAAGAGNIGHHFPDTDPSWKDADSVDLLTRAARIVREAGFAVVNVDVVVIAERPKIGPHVDAMRARLAGAIGCEAARVGIKGKTNEGADSIGRGESIAVHAVALLARAPSLEP
jgi:2-C-methyl-D-erythritol 4-phosphate cytidylyltransferase/2-C-methyl-D-erythritol 2,4-cyclodiphosphate synthase